MSTVNTYLTAIDARARSTIARARVTCIAAVVRRSATSRSAALVSDTACSPSDCLLVPSWCILGASSENHKTIKVWMKQEAAVSRFTKAVRTTTTTTVLRPFSGPTRVSRCQKRTLDFMVQEKVNRGRHTNHPARRHSIRTNHCPPPPSPHPTILGSQYSNYHY